MRRRETTNEVVEAAVSQPAGYQAPWLGRHIFGILLLACIAMCGSLLAIKLSGMG